jgi:ParB/RepB/Spo0J family partition protein
VSIPSSTIRAGSNDRTYFSEEALTDLAASIAQHGLAQPLTVRPVSGGFEIVAGERRFRAMSTILRWSSVPCLVRDLSDEEASAIMLAENTGRADLDPIEEAQAYQRRMTGFGWTPEHVAKVAGVSPQRVQRRLLLLGLLPEVQILVSKRNMPLGHAEAMAGLDSNRQSVLMRLFQKSRLVPLGTFRGMVSELRQQQEQEALFSFEEAWTVQLASTGPTARSGKNAPLVVPHGDPPADLSRCQNTGEVLDRYLRALLDSGATLEAQAVGTLYLHLVRGNYVAVPTDSPFLA